MDEPVVRQLEEPDLPWVRSVLAACGSGQVRVRRGELIDVLDLPGLVAELDGELGGFLTFRVTREECEIVALGVARRGRGVGSALLHHLLDVAAGRSRVWVVTTNDDLDGMRFLQRRGFVLAALWPRAALAARDRSGASGPDLGAGGVPRRDELELELLRPVRR